MKNENRIDFDEDSMVESIRDFLAKDSIPELGAEEVSIMTQKIVLATSKKRLRWFEMRPAFQIGLATAFVAVLIFVLNSPNKVFRAEETKTTYISETEVSEQTLVEAVEKGMIAESEIVGKLLDIKESERAMLGELYPRDIDKTIEKLSDDEIERIMRALDELGYPRKGEA